MSNAKQKSNQAKVASQTKSLEEQAYEAAENTAPISGKLSNRAGFKIKKLVTVPSLVMKIHGEERVLRFDTPITVSKVKDPKKPDEKPANVANVTDMESGEQFIFLVPSVVQANLEQEFEGEAYVDRIFLIKHCGKNPAKRYVNFSIAEVEAD